MKRLLIAMTFWLAFGAQGWADTDFTCLKACVNSGDKTRDCMPKCTYEPQTSATGNYPHAAPGCVKACISGGASGAVCVPKCTAASASPYPSNSPAHKKQDVHNQFNAPVPTEEIILKSPHVSAPTPVVDYGCMSACTQGHLEYQLCNQRCMQ